MRGSDSQVRLVGLFTINILYDMLEMIYLFFLALGFGIYHDNHQEIE